MIERILVVLAVPSFETQALESRAPESLALRLGLDLAVRHGAAATVLLVCKAWCACPGGGRRLGRRLAESNGLVAA
ncbi:MAG: hypothetical protein Q8S17_00645 [Humidesulfovibrio sp.]|nr:hypothetical protein [Humidesulfovibrio sp.]